MITSINICFFVVTCKHINFLDFLTTRLAALVSVKDVTFIVFDFLVSGRVFFLLQSLLTDYNILQTGRLLLRNVTVNEFFLPGLHFVVMFLQKNS